VTKLPSHILYVKRTYLHLINMITIPSLLVTVYRNFILILW